jgi:hypothetical protein
MEASTRLHYCSWIFLFPASELLYKLKWTQIEITEKYICMHEKAIFIVVYHSHHTLIMYIYNKVFCTHDVLL